MATSSGGGSEARGDGMEPGKESGTKMGAQKRSLTELWVLGVLMVLQVEAKGEVVSQPAAVPSLARVALLQEQLRDLRRFAGEDHAVAVVGAEGREEVAGDPEAQGAARGDEDAGDVGELPQLLQRGDGVDELHVEDGIPHGAEEAVADPHELGGNGGDEHDGELLEVAVVPHGVQVEQEVDDVGVDVHWNQDGTLRPQRPGHDGENVADGGALPGHGRRGGVGQAGLLVGDEHVGGAQRGQVAAVQIPRRGDAVGRAEEDAASAHGELPGGASDGRAVVEGGERHLDAGAAEGLGEEDALAVAELAAAGVEELEVRVAVVFELVRKGRVLEDVHEARPRQLVGGLGAQDGRRPCVAAEVTQPGVHHGERSDVVEVAVCDGDDVDVCGVLLEEFDAFALEVERPPAVQQHSEIKELVGRRACGISPTRLICCVAAGGNRAGRGPARRRASAACCARFGRRRRGTAGVL
ncbi:glycine betaine ABC transporter substrate-binding protein [Babesia caballi]|uniref:Glycine betaine ABC transporter substrate-binding protein n=1 Tax=Babesia caballi TaxID=5871 RepID=A0AAV4LVH8_BABCB|nr:glycine betaine ABC transporter substrate-binding protein [Babesia caballi]